MSRLLHILVIVLLTTAPSKARANTPEAPSNLRISHPCADQDLAATNPECQDGKVQLLGKPEWTLQLVDEWGIGWPGVRYLEQGLNGRRLALAVDRRGYPAVELMDNGQRLQARSPAPVDGSFRVQSHAVEDYGEGYTQVTLTIGEHPYSLANRIWVEGLGYPLDGEHTVTNHTHTTVSFVMTTPLASTPPGGGARRLPGYTSDISGASWNTGAANVFNHTFKAAPTATSWSIAGWLRKHSAAFDGENAAGIFSTSTIHAAPSASGVSLHLAKGADYQLQLGAQPPVSIGSAPLEQWVHVAVVRVGGEITLYYNGAKSGTAAVADASKPTVIDQLNFGFGANRNTQAPVDLDRWGFWFGRSLSAADVATLYQGGASAPLSTLPESLAAAFEFDEPYGDAIDSSVKGNSLGEMGLLPWSDGVVRIPYSPPSGAGRVTGSTILSNFSASATLQHLVLTVTKSNDGRVAFYRDGELLGQSSLAPAGAPVTVSPLPASSGLHGGVKRATAFLDAMSPTEVGKSSFQREVRISRTSGLVPLAVHFDATRIGGIYERDRQDYEYQWVFVGSDNRPLSTTGLAYNMPTGFYVSHVFNKVGTYTAWLSVRTPPFDRDGKPQAQQVVHSGPVGTIEVKAWPSHTTTFYVGGSDPSADDSNSGTAPGASLKTFERARALAKGKEYVRILLKRGEQHLLYDWQGEFKNQPGPLEIGAYGQTTLPAPILKSSDGQGKSIGLSGNRDIRFQDLHLLNVSFSVSGGNWHPLYYNLELEGIAAFYAPYQFGTTYSTADSIFMRQVGGGGGGYAFLVQPGALYSVSRVKVHDFSGLHIFRSHRVSKLHIAGLDVTTGTIGSTYANGCPTIRGETRWYVGTDIHCTAHGWLTAAVSDDGEGHWSEVGAQGVLTERNRSNGQHLGGNRITARYNTTGSTDVYDWGEATRNWSRADFVRFYRSRAPSVSPSAGSSLFTSQFEKIDGNGNTGTPLKAPEVALLQVSDNAIDLGLASGASGGRGGLRYQWQRSANGGQQWTDVPGATAASLVELNIGAGQYLYRMKVSDEASPPAVAFSAPVAAVVSAN